MIEAIFQFASESSANALLAFALIFGPAMLLPPIMPQPKKADKRTKVRPDKQAKASGQKSRPAKSKADKKKKRKADKPRKLKRPKADKLTPEQEVILARYKLGRDYVEPLN